VARTLSTAWRCTVRLGRLTSALAAVCRDVSVCPTKTDAQGVVTPASSCTTGSLVPTAEELTQGKSLSCACGGDAATEQLCQARAEAGARCGLAPRTSDDVFALHAHCARALRCPRRAAAA
jgi:hypothetical protein